LFDKVRIFCYTIVGGGNMTKVLALDQSSKVTGYAIFEDGKLGKYGKFSYTDSDPVDRLYKLFKDVMKMIEDENIDKVQMEDIQLQNSVGNNVTTFKVLAFAMYSIYMACKEKNVPCETISSSTWKSVCKVKGRTRPEQKRDAQRFVEETYGVKPIQDIVDAICIGHAVTMDSRALNWG